MKNLFEELEKLGVPVNEEQKNRITKKMDSIMNYTPKIGIFGKTGVGKSSLCNSLFGQDICPISDVAACTRDTKEVLLSVGKGKSISLLDVPGVGESNERDGEYAKLYASLLPELDLIMWILKGDDRAFASDEAFYKKLVKPYMDAGKAFLIVINQVDKIEPYREWDEEKRKPGIKQKFNIDLKIEDVSRFFDYPKSKIIPISANEKYNLETLVDEMVEVLPKEKKMIVLTKIQEEYVSEESANKAINGFWETVDEVLTTFIPGYSKIKSVGKFIDTIAESTGLKSFIKDKATDLKNNVEKGWNNVKSFFRR